MDSGAVTERTQLLEALVGGQLLALQLQRDQRAGQHGLVVAEVGEQVDEVALGGDGRLDPSRGQCRAKRLVKEGREVAVTLDAGLGSVVRAHAIGVSRLP